MTECSFLGKLSLKSTKAWDEHYKAMGSIPRECTNCDECKSRKWNCTVRWQRQLYAKCRSFWLVFRHFLKTLIYSSPARSITLVAAVNMNTRNMLIWSAYDTAWSANKKEPTHVNFAFQSCETEFRMENNVLILYEIHFILTVIVTLSLILTKGKHLKTLFDAHFETVLCKCNTKYWIIKKLMNRINTERTECWKWEFIVLNSEVCSLSKLTVFCWTRYVDLKLNCTFGKDHIFESE